MEKTSLNKDELKEITHLFINIPRVEKEHIVFKYYAEGIKI